MATRRRVVGITAASVVLVLVAAIVAVYWWQRPMLLTGTGYAAHNACAVTEVAGRDDPASDLPSNPLVPFLVTDGAGDPTSTTLFGLLSRQKAWFTDGFGCTLAPDRPDLGTPTVISGAPFDDAAVTAGTPGIRDALSRAFGDDLSPADAEILGTRGIVIVHHGEIIGERYADGFDVDTRQLGWSITKSVTSLMTGMLVAQDIVALNDDELLPEWTDGRADITIEDLLRMQSGLEWDETYDLGTPITRMLYLEPDMGAYVASLPLARPAGTVQEYSSGSTTLLCGVLAERTGLGADLPRQTILDALGLSSAILEPDAVGTPVCSSYLWATPREWATIGQFALQDGVWNGERLLPEGWMARSLTVVPTEMTDDPGYGMGWRVNPMPDGTLRWPELPDDTYYASGHDGQKLIVVPSKQLVVARLGFTPDGDADPRTVGLVEEVIAELR